jgi:DNA-binding CsgD family transcriptional regulator
LVRAFCDGAERTSLWGGCDALTTPQPLSPVVDMARQVGGALARAVAADAARHVLFSAFLELLAAHPVIAVIEDAHWADEATLDLLVFLGRRIGQTGSVLIITYREEAVGPSHPLRAVLGALAGRPEVRRIALPPLSHAAVAGIASAHGLDAAELYSRTGGNPFFVAEVVANPGPAVPVSVRDAVLARAAALAEPAREALYAVAIFPGGTALPLIQAPPDALDAGVGAGILARDGSGIRFRHELARLAIAGSTPPGRWAALHARALADLSARGAEPARLAYHAEEAGDEAAVLEHAIAAAGRAVALGAHRQAADHYAQALRCADGLPARRRAELLEAFAQTCARLGRGREAVELSAAAAARWRVAGDRGREAAARARHGYHLWQSGQDRAARASMHTALELAEGLPAGPWLAGVYTWSAVLLMLSCDVAGAVQTGRRAADLAERFGEHELLARALNAVGTVQWLRDAGAAERAIRRSLQAARRSGDDSAVAATLVNAGAGAAEARLYDTADAWLNGAADWCSRRDLDFFRGYANAWQARCLFERGRWTEAAGLLEIAPGDHLYATIVRLTVLGRMQVRRGDPGAAATLETAWQRAAPVGNLLYLWPVTAARAELAWLDGEPPDESVRTVYELAVRLGHQWAIGELGQWLEPDRAAHPAAAEPYRLDPVAAAGAWDRLGCPYEAALALARSAGHWTEALARLERLGAQPAARRLARLGHKQGLRAPHRPTLRHPHGLTRRQADVLKLLREGLSNAEIAERLSISPKTVDHHVSAILAKLGVRTRREAASYGEFASTR